VIYVIEKQTRLWDSLLSVCIKGYWSTAVSCRYVILLSGLPAREFVCQHRTWSSQFEQQLSVWTAGSGASV